jgi:hypothetical protein
MSQPKLGDPVIGQTELVPGESTLITIATKDRQGAVARVEGIVAEDTRLVLPMYDDGRALDTEGLYRDEAADDGIWSMAVKVPFTAPPGPYTLRLTAYDKDGEVVLVDGAGGETVPLVKTISFAIRYPTQDPEPEPEADDAPDQQ